MMTSRMVKRNVVMVKQNNFKEEPDGDLYNS